MTEKIADPWDGNFHVPRMKSVTSDPRVEISEPTRTAIVHHDIVRRAFMPTQKFFQGKFTPIPPMSPEMKELLERAGRAARNGQYRPRRQRLEFLQALLEKAERQSKDDRLMAALRDVARGD